MVYMILAEQFALVLEEDRGEVEARTIITAKNTSGNTCDYTLVDSNNLVLFDPEPRTITRANQALCSS
jgi:hypothetical protein